MEGLKQILLNIAIFLTEKKTKALILFIVLNDVSFTIEQVEIAGIIGHNRAGESPLLKGWLKLESRHMSEQQTIAVLLPLALLSQSSYKC